MSNQVNAQSYSLRVFNAAHSGYRRAGFVLDEGENVIADVPHQTFTKLKSDPRLSVEIIDATQTTSADSKTRGMGGESLHSATVEHSDNVLENGDAVQSTAEDVADEKTHENHNENVSENGDAVQSTAEDVTEAKIQKTESESTESSTEVSKVSTSRKTNKK